MQIAFAVAAVVVLLFGFVVWFGAPYLPTLRAQTDEALDLLDLAPGQTLLELGCGDGRVMRAAAQRGLKVIGYELNPLLVIVAWLATLRYRRQVRVVWGNFWHGTLPPADGIFVFLLDKYMAKLDKKVTQEQQGRVVKLVSFAFQIPDHKPTKTSKGLFLYKYK
jgi:16S rRNA A1518/A1519 N6-dimethyltransferase RsmA/KsgA/DIM1 with predicted DNA glycosylase/AP lyase activity